MAVKVVSDYSSTRIYIVVVWLLICMIAGLPAFVCAQSVPHSESHGIEFRVKDCWRTGKVVKCVMSVVNHNEKEGRLGFYADMYSDHDVAAIDDEGNQCDPLELFFGSEKRRAGLQLWGDLFPDIPVNVRMTYNGISKSSTTLNLTIIAHWQPGYEKISIALRGISIRPARADK